MVEQEHSKSSTVFPEALISNGSSQTYTPKAWIVNDAPSLIKSEESCTSDFLNVEMLYGSIFSADESICSSNLNGNTNCDNMFQGTIPNDAFLTNDLTPCDLFYNDRTMSYVTDFWHPVSDKVSSTFDSYFEANSPLSFWGNGPLDLETLKMDDVFQVDKDDLVQSPTLAKLNADNDESLFDSFDNFGMPLPSEDKLVKSTLIPGSNTNLVYKMPSLSETSDMKTSNEIPSDSTKRLIHQDAPTGKDNCTSDNETRTSFTKEKKSGSLSSDSDVTWANKHDFNPLVITKLNEQSYPLNESKTEASEEKKVEKVPQLQSSINSETFDSEEDDSEMDYDYSSDADEESEDDIKIHLTKQGPSNCLMLQKKKSRYFWQYNIQSKGPKAPKVKLDGKSCVSEELNGISDPGFMSSNRIKGVKHTGKTRRGDGNDLTPYPQKLYNIGLELEKLTSVIEGLIPANELPLNARSKSRKEKNKLASRACRLKKKAQHEANKLKLYGLQNEQKHLLDIISEVRKVIRKSVDTVKHGKIQSIHGKIESLCLKKRYTEVAGRSAEFVNKVLKNVDNGDKTGGLDIEAHDE